MPKMNPHTNGDGDLLPVKKEDKQDSLIPMVREPRCKVCTSKYRQQIELMIANGYTMPSIERQLKEVGEDISYRSITRHRQSHMDMRRAAFREIMEKQARELSEAQAEGAIRIVSGKAWLDLFIQEATDILIRGEMEIEARDVVKAIELRAALESEGISIFQEQVMVELRAIIQAMKELIAPELAREISIRAKELAVDIRHAELEATNPAIEDAEYEEA